MTLHAGKTSLVRDVARCLAHTKNVCIVDTSNEIGGEGDVPHPSIGEARRMMVTSLEAQAKIMVRCVQVRSLVDVTNVQLLGCSMSDLTIMTTFHTCDT
jgi:stage III sporulation protein SpoIIIAA